MDQIKELVLALTEKIVEVDGKKMIEVTVLVDLLHARKIKVATFPDGDPDGG